MSDHDHDHHQHPHGSSENNVVVQIDPVMMPTQTVSTVAGNHGNKEMASKKKNKKPYVLGKRTSLAIMLSMTTVYFFVEIIVGYMTNSNSLVADSFHMLNDHISLVIALVAIYFTNKKFTLPKVDSSDSISSGKFNSASTSHHKKYTFGWARAEVLGSLVNAVFLLSLCFSIIIDAIKRFIVPERIENVNLVLIVGGVGLLINLFGLVIFGFLADGHVHTHSHGSKSKHGHGHAEHEGDHHHNHSHDHDHHHGNSEHHHPHGTSKVKSIESGHKHGHESSAKKPAKNLNIHGVFLHVLADALGSIAVIVSGLIIKFAPPIQAEDDHSVNWKYYVDPVLSLIITSFIILSTLPLFKRSSMILLQSVPRDLDLDEVKTKIANLDGILDIHHLHVWSLNTDCYVASAHIKINTNDPNLSNNQTFPDGASKRDYLFEKVKDILHNFNIHSTTLQIEEERSLVNYDHCQNNSCEDNQCCVGTKKASQEQPLPITL